MNTLNCARCNVALEFVGTRDFHEGTRWGALGDLGEPFVKKERFDVYVCPRCGGVELFVKKERFDVYVCPRCGGVELFVDGIGEDLRSA